MRRIALTTTTTLALLALSVPALAHVTVQPSAATTASFSRFDVRVPNERDDADTTKVEVQFPDTLTSVSFQPKEGWERTVTMKTLDEPIEVFGREVTEVIDTVTWEGGTIAPGEFDEFGFTARTPEAADPLVFPAVQTYDGGEEVAWIEEPDGEAPAPVVELATADAEPTEATTESTEAADQATEAMDEATDEATGATPAVTEDATDVSAADATGTDDDGAATRATLALVVAVLGLLAALGAVVMARRRD